MDLELENERLRKLVSEYEAAGRLRTWLAALVGKFAVLVVAGPTLTASAIKLLDALRAPRGQFPSESLGHFVAALIRRLTGIGLMALTLALLPIILLWQQNRLIAAQIPLLQAQVDSTQEQSKMMRLQSEAALEQLSIFKKQVSASVRANVEIFYSESNAADLRIAVNSTGLGPAFFRKVELSLLGTRAPKFPTYAEYATAKGWSTNSWPKSPIMLDVGPLSEKSAIGSDDRFSIYHVDNGVFRRLSAEQQKQIVCNLPRDVVLTIDYCSAVDECQSASSKNLSIHPQCPMKPQ